MTPRIRNFGRLGAIVLVLVLASGEEPLRPTPQFTGKAIPDPPGQREAWMPPDTKLPRFIVNATAVLFEAGMADPRGCAYREVELGDANLTKTRGFVLPENPGEAVRFAVGWDGIVYPAFAVGPTSDLDADVRALTDAVTKARREAEAPGARLRIVGWIRGPEPFVFFVLCCNRPGDCRQPVPPQALHAPPHWPGRSGREALRGRDQLDARSIPP